MKAFEIARFMSQDYGAISRQCFQSKDSSSSIVGESSCSLKQKTMDVRSQKDIAASINGQSKLICASVNVALNRIWFFQTSHSLGGRVIRAFAKFIEVVIHVCRHKHEQRVKNAILQLKAIFCRN